MTTVSGMQRTTQFKSYKAAWLVVGAIALAVLSAWLGYGRGFHRGYMAGLDLEASAETGNAVQSVRALRHLRADQHEQAIESLETALDGTIISMVGLVNTEPALMRDPKRHELWSLVKEYRQGHPSRLGELEPVADFWQHLDQRDSGLQR